LAVIVRIAAGRSAADGSYPGKKQQSSRCFFLKRLLFDDFPGRLPKALNRAGGPAR
jgi:hypothetical protein